MDDMFSAADRYVEPGSVKKIADLGTGTGICSFISYSRYPEATKVTALDISGEMLNELKRSWDEAGMDSSVLETVESDFEDLKLPQSEFDYVVASFSLHHVPHEKKQGMLNSVNKIMKPGALLVIGETMFESQGSKLAIARIYKRKALNGLKNVGFSQFLREVDFYFKIIRKQGEYMATKEMWEEKLKNADFEVLEAKFSDPYLTYGYLIAKKK